MQFSRQKERRDTIFPFTKDAETRQKGINICHKNGKFDYPSCRICSRYSEEIACIEKNEVTEREREIDLDIFISCYQSK